MADVFDLGKSVAHFKKVMLYAPGMLGNDAVNFFLDRFTYQNWIGDSVQPWRRRKNPNKWGPLKNDSGRAILIQRARLKRSIRIIRAGNMEVLIGTDVPYARTHNEGLRVGQIQKVKEYKRKKTAFGIVQRKTLKRQSNIKFGRMDTGDTITVKAHTRRINQNIPKRQFMGESPYLTKLLGRRLQAEILKGLR